LLRHRIARVRLRARQSLGRPWAFDDRTEARAARLLLENLSPDQRDQYANNGFFDVMGGDTGSRYRIHCAPQANVEKLDANGDCARMYCFAPEFRTPIATTLLVQKIALELYESDAIAVANS
jgi:hypothetical protein